MERQIPEQQQALRDILLVLAVAVAVLVASMASGLVHNPTRPAAPPAVNVQPVQPPLIGAPDTGCSAYLEGPTC